MLWRSQQSPPAGASPSSRPRARLALWLWAGLALFLVLRTGGRERGVITDHLEFGRRLFAGEPLYAPFEDTGPLHSVYPPSFGLMTAPFTLLPERGARYAWGLLQVFALFTIGAWAIGVLRRLRPDLLPKRHLLLGIAALLMSRYLLRDTHGGGGNLLNLALALGAFRLAEARRPGLASLLLGLSLATKPTTLLLVPVLLVLGHVRCAVLAPLAALGFVAAAVGVHTLAAAGVDSAPLPGGGVGLDALAYWAEGAWSYGTRADVFAPALHELPEFTWMNQSLRCAVARFVGDVPPEFEAQVPGFIDGAGLPAAVTAQVARLLGAAVFGLTLFCAHRHRQHLWGRVATFAAALAAGLLLSPISWKAHHVALAPIALLLAIAVVDRRRAAAVLAAAYFLLCVAGGGDLVGSAVKEWQQSLYLATFGTIALWIFALRRAGDPDGAVSADSVSLTCSPP